MIYEASKANKSLMIAKQIFYVTWRLEKSGTWKRHLMNDIWIQMWVGQN